MGVKIDSSTVYAKKAVHTSEKSYGIRSSDDAVILFWDDPNNVTKKWKKQAELWLIIPFAILGSISLLTFPCWVYMVSKEGRYSRF